jgi:hypothetical protein
MAKKPTTTKSNEPLVIAPLDTGDAHFCILGMSPLIQNRMPEKARQELLFPRGGKMSSSDKRHHLKHNPLEEFRSAAHTPRGKDYSTRLIIPAGSFKKSLINATTDTEGAAKTQIIRLTWILGADGGNDIPVYGVPELVMSVVRMSNQDHTPDIRTRAILPQWACYLSVRFVKPQLTGQTIANLLARAGLLIGIGDWRHEKTGDYGMFRITSADDPQFLEIVKNGGKEAQEAALEEPNMYDSDTEDLYDFFGQEFARRERQPVTKKGSRNSEEEQEELTEVVS